MSAQDNEKNTSSSQQQQQQQQQPPPPFSGPFFTPNHQAGFDSRAPGHGIDHQDFSSTPHPFWTGFFPAAMRNHFVPFHGPPPHHHHEGAWPANTDAEPGQSRRERRRRQSRHAGRDDGGSDDEGQRSGTEKGDDVPRISPDTMDAEPSAHPSPPPPPPPPFGRDFGRHGHGHCHRGRGWCHRGRGGGMHHGDRHGGTHPRGPGEPFDWASMLRGFTNHPFFQQASHDAPFSPSPPPAADGSFRPPTDIFNTENAFVVHMALPGAKKEHIGVNWRSDDGTLIVSGVVHYPGDEAFIQGLVSGERKVGMFERHVVLPPPGVAGSDKEDVDGSGITAKMEDGVLIITVPKVEKEWTEIRKVDIE
ncbi:HSP20-like chaperone [Moelleriella libera RCEF 2490]|uniref:HSP20-like chaperone n=1 Tax=Moelleriella libera RCEF 2490 TaxID=1081109 RepID=A0A166V091_9HYPO|nr:HSP20-like chaperone [Moelleriella libera RCEF 2490]